MTFPSPVSWRWVPAHHMLALPMYEVRRVVSTVVRREDAGGGGGGGGALHWGVN